MISHHKDQKIIERAKGNLPSDQTECAIIPGRKESHDACKDEKRGSYSEMESNRMAENERVSEILVVTGHQRIAQE